MTPEKGPHLCGGIFFGLLLEARKLRRKTRDRLKGGSDGFSAPSVYAGLIHVVTGEDPSVFAGTTLEKCASDYKKCISSSGVYVPFTDPSTCSALDSAYKRKDPELFKRASEFIDRFLNINKCEWLVRALIEVMQNDDCAQGTRIAVNYSDTKLVSELDKEAQIVLLPFLVSVLHYVMVNHPDCESGRTTFEMWYSQASPKAEWKFRSNIGNGINPMNVLTDLSVPAAVQTPEVSVEASMDSMSDHEVITDSLMQSAKVMASVFGEAEHQLAEQIRKNKKKPASQEEADCAESEAVDETDPPDAESEKAKVVHQTIVNQYGDHPVHIDHVENLKL